MKMNWESCERSWFKYWVVSIHEQQLEIFNERVVITAATNTIPEGRQFVFC